MTSQANIYFFLGQIAVANGHPREAVPLIEKAVGLGSSVAPDHPVTKYMQDFLREVREKAGGD